MSADPNEERKLKQVISAVGDNDFNNAIRDLAKAQRRVKLAKGTAITTAVHNSGNDVA